MDIYKEVLNMLETVHSQVTKTTAYKPVDAHSTGSDVQNVSSQADGNNLVRVFLTYKLEAFALKVFLSQL